MTHDVTDCNVEVTVTHNLDAHKDDDGHEQQEDGAVHPDIVEQCRWVANDGAKERDLRENVSLHGKEGEVEGGR